MPGHCLAGTFRYSLELVAKIDDVNVVHMKEFSTPNLGVIK